VPESPSGDDVRAVVQLATLAPSVHNSQPWRWRWDGEVLELREDRSRALAVLDPSGRELVLSCGAALLGARLCLAELGWAAQVALLPDGDGGDVLARIRPTGRQEPTPDEHELALAAPRRVTDRDPYDRRALPPELLTALREAAEAEGAWLRVVGRDGDEVELEVLLAHADSAQRSDPAYLQELETWRTETGEVGVPTRALPTVPSSVRGDSLSLRDFDAGHPPAGDRSPSSADRSPEHPTVVVLGTQDDGRRDWLQAGQALMRVLLRATVDGVAAQPITSVLEVPPLRARLRSALGLVGHPQMVLRAGYGTAGPATHRLPVDEVLELVEV
jgi:nitroreductase